MSDLSRRLAALEGGEQGPVKLWVLAGDGFARCGDQVLPQDEFRQQYPQTRSFTLVLGDHTPSKAA